MVLHTRQLRQEALLRQSQLAPFSPLSRVSLSGRPVQRCGITSRTETLLTRLRPPHPLRAQTMRQALSRAQEHPQQVRGPSSCPHQSCGRSNSACCLLTGIASSSRSSRLVTCGRVVQTLIGTVHQCHRCLMSLRQTCQGLTHPCLSLEQLSALLPTVILIRTGPVALMLPSALLPVAAPVGAGSVGAGPVALLPVVILSRTCPPALVLPPPVLCSPTTPPGRQQSPGWLSTSQLSMTCHLCLHTRRHCHIRLLLSSGTLLFLSHHLLLCLPLRHTLASLKAQCCCHPLLLYLRKKTRIRAPRWQLWSLISLSLLLRHPHPLMLMWYPI